MLQGVCGLTISGQNDGPFSRQHEGLDGWEETNVVIEYDINLLEWRWGEQVNTILIRGPVIFSAEIEGCKQRAKHAVSCLFVVFASWVFRQDEKSGCWNECKTEFYFACVPGCTSSNRIRDVMVFLWRVEVPSGPEDEQPSVLLAALLDCNSPPECNASAFAFTLKKSARVTAAWLRFCFRAERPSFCAALFFVELLPVLGCSVFTVGGKQDGKSWQFGGIKNIPVFTTSPCLVSVWVGCISKYVT